MRKLTPKFMTALRDGILTPLLKKVQQDRDLILEIRPDDTIDIYYKGHRVLGLTRSKNSNRYSIERHEKFKVNNITTIESREQAKEFVKDIIFIKDKISQLRSSGNEREFQQLVVRENNIGVNARDTDYFICDIEYEITNKENKKCKFDMIGAHWPSDRNIRKQDKDIEIVIIEMKYFNKSIASIKHSKKKREKGSAGLYDHASDFSSLLSDKRLIDSLKNDALNAFKFSLHCTMFSDAMCFKKSNCSCVSNGRIDSLSLLFKSDHLFLLFFTSLK